MLVSLRSRRRVSEATAHLPGQALHVLALRWIPWNNNNAEHAVKRFAYYREIADGYFSEPGLQEYLTLLSLDVTCKYKGVSFLQFLLSREKDIDVFAAGRSEKSAPPPIELVPWTGLCSLVGNGLVTGIRSSNGVIGKSRDNRTARHRTRRSRGESGCATKVRTRIPYILCPFAQIMWAQLTVCRLFAGNVGSLAANVG